MKLKILNFCLFILLCSSAFTQSGGQGSKPDSFDDTLTTKPHLVSTPKRKTYDCQAEGKQVVKVCINREGKVISAKGNQPGTTIMNDCVKKTAEKLAKEEIYNADSKAPETRTCFTTLYFYLD